MDQDGLAPARRGMGRSKRRLASQKVEDIRFDHSTFEHTSVAWWLHRMQFRRRWRIDTGIGATLRLAQRCEPLSMGGGVSIALARARYKLRRIICSLTRLTWKFDTRLGSNITMKQYACQSHHSRGSIMNLQSAKAVLQLP